MSNGDRATDVIPHATLGAIKSKHVAGILRVPAAKNTLSHLEGPFVTVHVLPSLWVAEEGNTTGRSQGSAFQKLHGASNSIGLQT